LAEQTAEAAAGVTGHSEFDKTLDALGGTLFRVKDAIEGADASQEKNNETIDIAANNAKKLAAVQKELEQTMIDRQKVEDELWKVEKKSLEETTKLWDEYLATLTKNTGTSFDAQKAAIQQWFDDEVAKLDDSDRNWQEHYRALEAVAKEKLHAIESDWDSVKDKSFEALQQTADRARETYNDMLTSGLHFSHEVLDAQRDKVEKLTDAARGMGEEYVKAHDAATERAKKQEDELKAVEKAARAAADAARQLGGAFEVTSSNIQQTAAQMHLDVGRVMQLARKGYSFAEIIAILSNQRPDDNRPNGPRIQGFKDGGTVDIMVGENGPEVARVPLGTTIYPTGTRPADGGMTMNFYVNGTAVQVAQQIKNLIMRELMTRKQM
jgi:hypothetical protein